MTDYPRPSAGVATPPRQPWMPPAAYQQPIAMPWITHFDPDPPARGSSFVRGVLGGIIVCLLLGSAGWFAVRPYIWPNSSIPFSSLLGSHPAASSPAASSPVASQPVLPTSDLPNDVNTTNPVPPRQGQSAAKPARSHKLNPNTQPHPDTESADTSGVKPKAAAAPEASASSQSSSPKAPIAELAPAGTLSVERGSPAPAPQHIAKVPASQPPPAADTGESQLMLARQYLDGHAHPRNPTVASQLLWSAIEKGNSTAETTLAGLYLRGDGVTRNCDQAHVLLSAASRKGNPEAMQKLQELNRNGCR
jgi:hypothetical protein